MRSTLILSTLALVVPALCVPTLVPITKRAGPFKSNSFVVKFRDGVHKDTVLGPLTKGLTQAGSGVQYNYDDSLFNGFAMTLFGPDLTFVRQFQHIESVEQDTIMSIFYEEGLDGLSTVERSQVPPSLSLDKRANDGTGVTVYSIDTGIYLQHTCFGGRASWGKTFGGYADQDGNGHGTHTAGTAVGKNFGFATGANIIAIKVLSDQGSGAMSDVLAGVNYAFQQFKQSGRPGVATMSLGGAGASNSALNIGIKNAIAGGLHFTVAAGNSNMPADTTSPANTQEANTIGAVDAKNQKASFSNYGRYIDVWAPGVGIVSAWIGDNTSTKQLSGTSMATPYVAGILAVALQDPQNAKLSGAQLSQKLKANAAKVVTFALPADAAAQVTSNNLLARPF
ncbi:Serine protease [Ceratobasidium theobromae]|uniref:Serine protease n=1 Tax=Ceratobasidium theobromae TaxID=1582974 RepID=A0A5N5Q7P9_9AGAM|nr:Serine protease [Ceratobasidium theobromae]